ncbi:LysR family transcriptional regulator [Cohnella cholangitidis]|uniref:LysR family transcriptional regulator n=1 Tax=Cohnella cholangitidis TaxID=2598458 RepID=A0A7G5C634_9BACL|nr:LysR family transcriptional regulator [Cohnella cholangitidis]QMV44668.1 LysR family transcriptional regulator [Cohnella cholangitidis]
MDFLQLSYFQHVARLEHMTKAADELKISQPSLSQSIARLEDELGFPLFERSGRNIRLNESGKVFLGRVNKAFSELKEGKREAARKAGIVKQSISLGMIHLEEMPDFLGAYMSQTANTQVKLQYGCNKSMTNQLERGELDLFVCSPLVQHAGLQSVALHEEEIYLAVPPNHRLSGASQIRLEEVSNDPFIGLQEGSGLREASDEFCRIAGFKPDIALEIADPSRLQTLVQAGIGVALIPETLVKQLDGVKACGIVKITEPICKRTIGLTWEKETELPENVQLFKEYLLDYFASTKAAIE